MPNFEELEAYHRRISVDSNEYEKVSSSMEVWGGQAKVLRHGVCVQAWPFHCPDGHEGYSFGSPVTAMISYGFRGTEVLVTEVRWAINMDGVESREGGEFACIPIDWIER